MYPGKEPYNISYRPDFDQTPRRRHCGFVQVTVKATKFDKKNVLLIVILYKLR